MSQVTEEAAAIRYADSTLSDEQKDSALRQVCANAGDAAEARMLARMLGLLEDDNDERRARMGVQRKVQICSGDGCDRVVVAVRRADQLLPGQYRLDAEGMCTRCYGRVRRARNAVPKKPKEPVECRSGCGRMVRPRRTPAADFPGTVAGTGGRCRTCERKAARDRQEVAA